MDGWMDGVRLGGWGGGRCWGGHGGTHGTAAVVKSYILICRQQDERAQLGLHLVWAFATLKPTSSDIHSPSLYLLILLCSTTS